MSDIVKFTDIELQAIAKLQTDYQQNIYMLGQIDLEKTDLEQQLQSLNNKKLNPVFTPGFLFYLVGSPIEASSTIALISDSISFMRSL